VLGIAGDLGFENEECGEIGIEGELGSIVVDVDVTESGEGGSSALPMRWTITALVQGVVSRPLGIDSFINLESAVGLGSVLETTNGH
jgi:hypothetical protein